MSGRKVVKLRKVRKSAEEREDEQTVEMILKATAQSRGAAAQARDAA